MKPAPFADFCARYGFDLTLGQRVLTRVCFDGAAIDDFEGTERERAIDLFGVATDVSELARAVCVWLKGARIGGSRMAAMRLYQLAHTVDLDVAPGESAYGLIVAPDMRLAKQAFAYARGAAKEDERRGFITLERETKTSFSFVRHDGVLVTIECLPATVGGSAVRGRTLFGAVMTEAAFFKDDDFAVNDTEVYRAILPRVVPSGQLILESTPWSAEGLIFDLFSTNHGRPSTALAARAPTLLMREDPRTRALVAAEEQRDPDNAAREFGAEFMSAGASSFFDPIAIDAAMAAVVDV